MLITEPFFLMDKEYVREHMDTENCIRLMEKTLREEYAGAFTQYLRHVTPLPAGGILGFMPACSLEGYFGAKVLSVYPQNSRQGFPSHQGVILLFESKNGQLLAAVDATEVTRIRTGAVSAVASRILARPDSSVLALLGTGEQAVSHLEAMNCAFPLREVYVWNRSFAKAEQFCRKNAALVSSVRLIPTDRVREACQNADIICTLTQSKEPLFSRDDIKAGTHICAVGSCTKEARELDSQTVRDARFFCDKEESVFAEAGDFVIPLQEGTIEKSHLLGSLGALLAGDVRGRLSDEDITVFESLGLAVEDLACAVYLFKAAREQLS